MRAVSASLPPAFGFRDGTFPWGFSSLRSGDSVIFTDMDGVITSYQVVALDVLHPTAVEEMTAGFYDLTLFTCTYGGKSRVTIYCNKISEFSEES